MATDAKPWLRTPKKPVSTASPLARKVLSTSPEHSNGTSRPPVPSYWKFLVFSSAFLACCCLVLTRKNVVYAGPSLTKALNFAKSDVGILTTTTSIAIAASRLVAGFLVDNYPTRWLLSSILLLSGVCTLVIPQALPHGPLFYIPLWALNGVAQGLAWPCTAKLIYQWFPPQQRATYWSMAAMSDSISSTLLAYFGSWLVVTYGWYSIFYFPASLCIANAFAVLHLVSESKKGSPESTVQSASKIEVKPLESKDRDTILSVLQNKYILLLCATDMLVCIIRAAVSDWTLLLLHELKHIDEVDASRIHLWFSIGGALGTSLCGRISDRIFKGNRSIVTFLYVLLLILTSGLSWLMMHWDSYLVNSGLLFMMGFAVAGPHTLLGLIAMELVGDRGGTANAMVGVFASIGASLAGSPLSYFIDQSWVYLYIVLNFCAVLATATMAPFLTYKSVVTRLDFGNAK